MQNIHEIAASILPGITAEDLAASLKEPAMHVFDAIIVREQIERKFGFEIPDKIWNEFHTISESLAWCKQVRGKHSKVSVDRSLEIRMPQMANAGLSENWLLKEMGDMHWEMLSKGLGQPSSEFVDAAGNRLYAAFVRICYTLDPLSTFKENETLKMSGNMKRFEDYAYLSNISGSCGQKTINAHLMTSFLARRNNDNAQIARSMPELAANIIGRMAIAPSFYTEHRLLKKDRMPEIKSGGYTFTITNKKIASIDHNINPHFEINGAGLLYFASYPLIADKCTSFFFRSEPGMRNYDKSYHTIHRDIFFFANCNADDEIVVDLNSVDQLEDGKIQTRTSMYRKSDNKLMAQILTVKQRV